MDFVGAVRRAGWVSTLVAGRMLHSDRPKSELIWDRLAGAALLLAALLVAFTFADYGVTWDEDVHSWYGGLALNYYLSLFADRRALNWLNLYNYGAAFDMAAAAVNRVSPFG